MRTVRLSIAVSALLCLAGSGALAQDRGDYVGWIDTTFAFAADGYVELAQVSGSVTVRTWNRNEVRVRGYAEHVPLETRFSAREVYVGLDIPDRAGRRTRIGDSEFVVTVPASARVAAKSVSGDVVVEGSRGRLSAGSVSGEVIVDGGRDEITVSSVSGDVLLSNASGRVSVNTVSGDLAMTDIQGDVTASAVSGDLMLQRVRARLIAAKTVSGDVGFEGPIAADGRYELTTHSGDVLLQLPRDVNGILRVSTFSGELDSEFPVVIGPGSSMRRGQSAMESKLGSGNGGTISVKTFGGDVLIRRGRG